MSHAISFWKPTILHFRNIGMILTMAGLLLSSYPQSTWDAAACSLRDNYGVALVDIPELSLQQVSKQAFQSTLSHLSILQEDSSEHISPTADSAHATGYHGASDTSSMSRYNQFRQGLVFSDAGKLQNVDQHFDDLQVDLDALEDLLHSVAEHVCRGIERDLVLPEDWFQNHYGPTRSSSQWHIKRYVVPEATTFAGGSPQPDHDLLPIHTDPSLISVVIHDRTITQEGCQGLKFCNGAGDNRQYTEVPRSGHGVAVVLVGSVLSHITGNYYPACRHFVAAATANVISEHRMAATLFLRPAGMAKLVVPPSLKLKDLTLKRHDMSFNEWNTRVSKRYMKGAGKAKTKLRIDMN